MRTAIAQRAVAAFRKERPVYVTLNNKAEGSATISAVRLAASIIERLVP
jgi:hypothetical protein